MKQAQLVHIMGDIHGDWAFLNTFINRKIRKNGALRAKAAEYDEFEVVFLMCGDFGYWPHTDPHHTYFILGQTQPADGDDKPYGIKNAVDFIKDGHIKIYWCDGNHENHDALDELERLLPDTPFPPVMPGVYFARFGSVLTLLNGTTVMFCGGAASDDANLREAYKDWWWQERVDAADMERLPDPDETPVDWVISHTSPLSFKITDKRAWPPKDQDSSRRHLETVRERFRPSQWWFGHYHLHEAGLFDGCRWACMDHPGNIGRWVEKRVIEVDTDAPRLFRKRLFTGTKRTRIFFDTEFSDLENPELISLGAISEDGAREFYAEVEPLPETCSDFVRERVLPQLSGPKLPADELARAFLEWLRGFGTDVELFSDSDADRDLLENLCAGTAMDILGSVACAWRCLPGGNGVNPHHALEDARLLRQRHLCESAKYHKDGNDDD